MTAGPTKGAEKLHGQPGQWQARPGLARALRAGIFLAPLLVSILFTWIAGRVAPPEAVGVNRWVWIGIVFVLANVLLVLLRKLTSRLMPLVALMKMTLVFPDQAPSRTKNTLRRSSSRRLLREIQEAHERGEKTSEAKHSDYLVELLKEISEHDRLTRGHSERVRVYAEMIGEELNLGDDDMNKLRWSALLHDVGKLTVPSEILNSPGRPTDEEWEVLSGHPAAALPFLEPLEDWLGDWIHSADQHHCRWDGKGYPYDLAGTDITLAGRLIAVADAYDVMTSTRSYKKPLPIEIARQELTDCAGGQFDPTMVRAFLRISLGRLRFVGGPLAWLANLTGSFQIPVPVAGTVTSTVWSTGIATAGMVAAGATGALAASPPQLLPFAEPTVTAYDAAVFTEEDVAIDVALRVTSSGSDLSIIIGAPAFGEAALTSTLEPAQVESIAAVAGSEWISSVRYEPAEGFSGIDRFSFQVCLERSVCSRGEVTVEVISGNQAPFSSSIEVTTSANTPVVIDALARVTDPDDDEVGLVSATQGEHGTVQIVDGVIVYTPADDYVGDDQFTFTAGDPDDAVTTATVQIEVVAVDPEPVEEELAIDPPEAVADSGTGFATDEDLAFVTGDALANDRFEQGDTLPLVTIVALPQRGSVSSNNDGTFWYVPNADVNGSDEFTYTITDATGLESEPATVTIEITPVDDGPQAVDDAGEGYSVDEDESLTTADVTLNDGDPDGPLSFDEITVGRAPIHGQLENNGDGTFTYTPDADFAGTDSFTYQLIGADGVASDEAEVTIEVREINDAPVVADDSGAGFATTEDTSFVTEPVTLNDVDVDDDIEALRIQIVDGPDRGELVNLGDGSFRYTPEPEFVGTDGFTYVLIDPDAASSSVATVTITVGPVNDAPVAVDDGGLGFETAEDVSFTTPDVRLNDSDADDDILTATVTVGVPPSNGDVVANDDGTFTYTPALDFNGTDSFTYVVSDGSLASDSATVTILVTPVNDAPVAIDDGGPGFEGPEDGVLALGDVLANDLDDGELDLSSLVVVTEPANGTLTPGVDGGLSYMPEPDFFGTDSFTYVISDIEGLTSEPASVTVTIVAVNDAPIAQPDAGDAFTTWEDLAFVTGDVTANDGDLEDGDVVPSSVELVRPPLHGTAIANGDGTFTYTPDENFNGADTFTYRVQDRMGAISAPATVDIVIRSGNDAPTAADDGGFGFATAEDTPFTTPTVLANDTDIEDARLEGSGIVLLSEPTHGTVVANGDGTFTYTPSPHYFGADSFTYAVSDSGLTLSNEATVSIVVQSVNDVPVAASDSGAGLATAEDTPFTTADVTANDGDVEDGAVDAASIVLVSDVANGVLVSNGDGTFTYSPNAEFFGTDSFSYTVTDADGAVSAPAVVTIVVESANDVPVANDDNGAGFSTVEDTPFTTADVTANDSDVEDGAADAASIVIVSDVANGVLVSNGDGTFVYSPNAEFFGTDSFSYTVTDADGAVSAPAVVTIVVESVNDVPVAASDSGAGLATAEDTPFTTADVTANDGDVEDGAVDAASIVVLSDVANGVLVSNGDGTFVYSPNAEFFGTDSFSYTVTDADGAVSAPATVTILVESVNDVPVANDDSGAGFATAEDTPLTTADVSANDSDVEDGAVDAASIVIVSDVASGVLVSNGDGTFSYTPDADFFGSDSFSYTVTDADGAVSALATVTIVVESVNDVPVANDDNGVGYATLEDAAFTTGSVTANDTDVEDGTVEPATIAIVADVANGVLVAELDGTFGYTPDPGFHGTDSFSYTVTDSEGAGSAPAIVTVVVVSVNDAPVANPDSGVGFVTDEDTPFSTSNVVANDADTEDGPVDPASAQIVTAAANGVATTNGDGTFAYTPNPDFNGTDTFSYTVTDSEGAISEPATVTIVVEPVNDAPVANEDVFTTIEDTALFTTGDVTANDTDVEDGTVVATTVTLVAPPANGSLTPNGDGTFAYIPDANFNGADTFTYTVTDSEGAVSEPALVTIVVESDNDVPVANNDAGVGFATLEDTPFTTPDVTANDSDVEDGSADPASIVVVADVSNGALANNGDGTFTYTPNAHFNGSDAFTYTITDSDGATSAPAAVTIVIDPVNDAPSAADDAGAGFATDEDVSFTTPSVTANDSDVEDGTIDPASVAVVADVANGTLINNGDGTFTYTPGADFEGSDNFAYTISDADGAPSAPAIVTIEIAAINDAPVASDDAGTGFSTAEDTPFTTAAVTANDVDVEDGAPNPATVLIVADVLNGTLSANGDGTFGYSPDADFNGTDNFAYTITDADGTMSAPATVTIEITAVNDAPIATDDAGIGFVTAEDTTLTTADVTANDTDLEDGTVSAATVAIVDPASNGTATANGDGTFTYVPDDDFFGTDTFTYTVADTDGALAEAATVTISVTEENDPPVAEPDSGAGLMTLEDVPFVTPDLTANDFDAEDGAIDPSTAQVVTDPANGTVVPQGDGTFLYTPNPNFNGTDTFTYRVVDSGLLTSNAVAVTIFVEAVNDPPITVDDAGDGYTTVEDTPFTTPDVLFNDGDPEDGAIVASNVELVEDATNGSAVSNGDGTFAYTPDPDFYGTDMFRYRVKDIDGLAAASATVTIVVTPVNDAPVAVNDAGVGFETLEDVPFTTGSVAANDTDVDSAVDATTVTVVTAPTLGSATSNGDGTFNYTPNADAFGTDTFTYLITDDAGLDSNEATVTIVVIQDNDPPLAVDDGGAAYVADEDTPFITPDVTANDSDPEDGAIDPTTAVLVADATNGSATSNGDGTFTYTPKMDFNGTDSFTYTIADADGAVSEVATVTITVQEINDPPTTQDDGGIGFTTDEDVTFTTASVLTNDSDPEDGTLDPANVSIDRRPRDGRITYNGDGTFTYIPKADRFGDDTFTYTVEDSAGAVSAATTVTVTVNPVNDAPVTTNPGTLPAVVTEAFSYQLITNDVENDGISYVATGLPPGLSMSATGLISGTVSVGDAGVYTVTIDTTDDGTPIAETTSMTFTIDVALWAVSANIGDIAVTEIFYRSSLTPVHEFIELTNISGAPVDLTGWRMGDSNLRVEGVGGFNDAFPATDNFGRPSVLQPGEIALVWTVEWSGAGGAAADLEFTMGGGLPRLGDSGDDVWLLDGSERIVDYVAYGAIEVDTPPPAALGLWDDTYQTTLTADGASIALTPHGVDGNTSACWEPTGSGDAAGRCLGALMTTDSDAGILVSSPGINNNAVDANAGGPYSINEGEALTLDASATPGTHTEWAWDLDGDGAYDDAVGMTPTVPWADLFALGLNDNRTYEIGLEVAGGLGTDTATVEILDVAAELVVSGSSAATAGGVYSLSLDATDPGDDAIAEWTVVWGDGAIDTITVVDGVATVATHTYATAGFTYDIVVSALDDTGARLTNSKMLVPSFDDNELYVFDGAGGFIANPAAGTEPIKAEIGPDGLLYVSSEQTGEVRRHDRNTGAYVDTFIAAGTGGMDKAAGLAFGPTGDLYVSNASDRNVLRFDGTTGTLVGIFASTGLLDPYDLVFDAVGNLYVGDYASDQVLRYSGVDGMLLGVFVSAGSGGLADPEQIAFGPDGNLYVSSHNNDHIMRYSGVDGSFIDIFIVGGTSGDPGVLHKPSGLAFGPDGNLYVGDFQDHSVLRFDSVTGAFIDEFVPEGTAGFTKPVMITFTPDLLVTVS